MLEEMFIEWAKKYYRNSDRTRPDVIILYREGLSDAQAKDQLPRSEIPALENMVKIIGSKTNKEDYDPEVYVVLVNKKINTRIF